MALGTKKDVMPTTSSMVVGESPKQAEQPTSNGKIAGKLSGGSMLQIVEGLCYVHPHQPELLGSHPVMRGVWHKCLSLLKNGTAMAPLLVDDRSQEGALCMQSVEHLIHTTTGRKYESLPWLGERVSEAALEDKYGDIGCEALDAIYHLEILGQFSLMVREWRWIVVHPLSFKEQQCGMLTELLQRLAGSIKLGVVAERLQKNQNVLWAEIRQSVLDRFRHHWIGESGRLQETTHPIYFQKKIMHQLIVPSE